MQHDNHTAPTGVIGLITTGIGWVIAQMRHYDADVQLFSHYLGVASMIVGFGLALHKLYTLLKEKK